MQEKPPPEKVREIFETPPKRYVEGRVKTVTRVKSELPSPPPTPALRIKSEMPDPRPVIPTRRASVVTFIPKALSPRVRGISTLMRRQSSMAPSTRDISVFKTPSPLKRGKLTSSGPATWPRRSRQPPAGPSGTRHPSMTPSLAGSIHEEGRRLFQSTPNDPIEIDVSPPSSPTPCFSREHTRESRSFTPMSNIDAMSNRSMPIFRGSSEHAQLEDPFIPPRQKTIRRREGAEEALKSNPPPPITVLPPLPYELRSALIEAEAIIRDIRGRDGEETVAAKQQQDGQAVVWLYEALMGQPGEDRKALAQLVSDALDAPDVALVANLLTLFHDAGKTAVMGHLRGYNMDSKIRRLPATVRQAEWYAGWKMYLVLHAGEELKAVMQSGTARGIFEAFQEVMMIESRKRLEKLQPVLPGVTREQFRRWRNAVVIRLSDQILLETFGRT
ncbi:hypothetical protein DB88DRAFT_533089 [Papiliotrema laurentii]|uniref:Uncharacterized protein n=1 Tax=Papiliotrema laurentii TaxID=5418 RepID=A0AAD9FK33_PAPLA|nr:hypothetical protein DB88DRAFT_533089 [Papiliotrema laurentii]